ncbi:MAG TPA: 50S ribosomal protein L11 methyltransferase [Thermoanaerobaculia bacterium]|jgi:ribosomal protein L11 methyltransferase|nr:50S ribosomal protein L11 methyltransferase [Thermoanaerobaculia bacterium]
MPYLRRFYHVPAELEEIVLADLWEAGTLGVQSEAGPDEVRLEAWFPEGSDPQVNLRPGVREGMEDTVPDLDWLASYRAQATPFPVGRGLYIDPREPEEAELEIPEGRRLLRLPARTAFGIGSHESTSLAVELLEDCELRGKRVLDVGTGTGILAFASLMLGAAEVVAFDIDPASPFNAMVNRRLNDLHPRLFIGTSAALRADVRFDLELINVIPEEIGPEMPGLVDRLAPDGEAILSGILEEKGDEVLEAVGRLGLVERERRTAGEWIAFRVAKAPRWR